MTEDEYAKIQEYNKKEQLVMDAFQPYFKTDKIKNPNLRHTYTSLECELTIAGKVTIAYGSPDDSQGWLNDFFNNCDEGYDDILRQGADTKENLVIAEEGIEDIRNKVKAKTKLLQALRKDIINE